MGMILFNSGDTEMVSTSFKTPATIAGFNLAHTTHEEDDDGLVTSTTCGDTVTFERLLVASDYDVDCHGNITSEGVIASSPLRDECGNVVVLDACHDVVTINVVGTYRAVYSGDGREQAIVTKD